MEFRQNLKLGVLIVHVMMYFVKKKVETQTHYRIIHMKMNILAPVFVRTNIE
jgi:uncharacterized membrane protein required for colicin V production